MTASASPPPRASVLGNFVQACCWQVARLPAPGETLQAHGFHKEAGGKVLNVAVGLQRLGARVQTLIGGGQDAAADELLALLATEGVDATHVHRLPGPSGWGAGLIGADGHNTIAVYPGANGLLTAAHAEAARSAIEAAALVYGQFETALPAVQVAFEIAHRQGVPTVLNPSPWQAPPAALRSATHTLIVNELEAAGLLDAPALLTLAVADIARAVRQRQQALAIAWPALRRLVHVPAPAVDALDTVGAGDGFACGYVTAVLAGQALGTALVWGNLCGAHVAARRGVLDALPFAAQLEGLLAGPWPPPEKLTC